jgi:hypothetical protein
VELDLHLVVAEQLPKRHLTQIQMVLLAELED